MISLAVDVQTNLDWNPEDYHRLSTPQFEWSEKVLRRLRLSGHETVMDAGCGTGRLTGALLQLLPHGRVLAVDVSSTND